MDEPRRELLVALGDDGGRTALDWALARALRTGLDLRLVHVVHPPRGLAGPENVLVSFDAVEQAGRQIVQAAADRVKDVAGDRLAVRTSAPTGHAVGVLARMAAGCEAVVAQHRPHARGSYVFGGSVAAGVAGRVDVPLVSVPDDWDPPHRPDGGDLAALQRVTVGVAGIDDAETLVARALAAVGPGGCLTLLHTWHVPAAYELALLPPDFETGWVERETRVLDDLAARWREKHPDIEVETRLERGHPAAALVDASHDSAHLVLGRSHPRPGRHVGSVAAALLRHSGCPVEVVPPATPDRSPLP